MIFVSKIAALFHKFNLAIVTAGDSSQHIELISVAFQSFIKIASTLPPLQREHVRAVAILLYSGMPTSHSFVSLCLKMRIHRASKG